MVATNSTESADWVCQHTSVNYGHARRISATILTRNVRSRHNKWWKVVWMSISNLFGKSLDSDSGPRVFFNVRICHKLYSCYFTFSKLINPFSPMENQSYVQGKSKKMSFIVFHLIDMHVVLTIIVTNSDCDSIRFNTTHSIQSTSLKSTGKDLAWFRNVIIDDWQQNMIFWEALKGLNICEVKLSSSNNLVITAIVGCKKN